MLLEQLLELADRRALDLQIGVVPGLMRRRAAGVAGCVVRVRRTAAAAAALIVGAEIDAADDRDLAVGDQDLAVVAVVDGESASGLSGLNCRTRMPALRSRSKNAPGVESEPTLS